MNEPATDTIPEKIGKYEIVSKIGEGGFGIVYKGHDPFIKRIVAVKTCNSDQDVIRKRFFREAEIAGNLRHDNVVTIHDFGVHEELPFLVQELLTGEDLDVLIKNSYDTLDMPFKLRCLREVAEGLHYAHEQGVIHRDVKPANIRILDNGRIKVLDFGIAKFQDQKTQLTKTGMTLGTVSYLSPEQLRGDKVDHRVDIFAFGVLAYELLCKKKPFEAKSISNLFYKLLHEDAPPVTANDLPPGLGAIVKRCLEKDADDRYSSLGDTVKDLHQIQATSGNLHDTMSFPGQGPPDVASTVREALRAGELTAAEFSLDLARKQMGDSNEFNRRFGALQQQLEAIKESGPQAIPERTPGPLLAADVAEVQKRIGDEEYQGAETKLIALSESRRGDPQIEELWAVLRRARTGTAGELPIHESGPLPLPWWQARQNKLLVLGIGSAFLIILVIVWLLARGSGNQPPPSPPPSEAIEEAVATPQPEGTLSNDQATPATQTAEPSESLILEPTSGPRPGELRPAGQPESGIPIEEWSGDSTGEAKEIPLEEFSGDGSGA